MRVQTGQWFVGMGLKDKRETEGEDEREGRRSDEQVEQA